MKQFVAAILISTDDEFIFQKRDNNPNIAAPGKVTNFGGNIEEGEDPQDAVVREMEEELGLKLNKENFRSLGSHRKKKVSDNREVLMHLFVAHDINKRDLTLKEGEAIIYHKVNQPLDSLPLSEMTQEALNIFKNGFNHLPQ